MAIGSEFQEQVRQLGKLITQFDQMPDGPPRTACKELVQLLMDVHGAGLDRIMEIVFESDGPGPAIIDKLGNDTVTSSLLLLYSLHPQDLETRVQQSVDRMRPRLRKLSCSVELAGIIEGAVQVRVTAGGHSCGSSSKDIRTIVEECVFELAPDIVSLEVLGLEEPSNSGFVALESLIGHSVVAPAHNARSLTTEGAD
ncbi:MAG TPA: NifU family protein [Terracidiphilus sp.]|nr:NifU family protein [Terracidiphilus sp.]